MGFEWSINPYRGCSHACHYCYARDTHRYLNFGIGEDFSRKLIVKEHFSETLRNNLRNVSIHDIVTLGTATDPYQPIEAKYRITRSILEVLAHSGHAVSITTKSPLILRDLDLLTPMAKRGQVEVHISLISLDRNHLRILEPGTGSPNRRVKTMAKLLASGIPTGWFLAPILPFITDQDSVLEPIFSLARTMKVRWLMAGAAHFTPSVYHYFYQTISSTSLSPNLHQFTSVYQGSNRTLKNPYRQHLRRRLECLYQRYGIMSTTQGPRGYEPFQQSEFLFTYPNTSAANK